MASRQRTPKGMRVYAPPSSELSQRYVGLLQQTVKDWGAYVDEVPGSAINLEFSETQLEDTFMSADPVPGSPPVCEITVYPKLYDDSVSDQDIKAPVRRRATDRPALEMVIRMPS